MNQELREVLVVGVVGLVGLNESLGEIWWPARSGRGDAPSGGR